MLLLKFKMVPSAIQWSVLWRGSFNDKTERSCYSDKIAEFEKSQKRSFRITKVPIGDMGEIILPSCSSDNSLAEKFNDLFMRKTAEKRVSVDADNHSMIETVVMDAEVAFKE